MWKECGYGKGTTVKPITPAHLNAAYNPGTIEVGIYMQNHIMHTESFDKQEPLVLYKAIYTVRDAGTPGTASDVATLAGDHTWPIHLCRS